MPIPSIQKTWASFRKRPYSLLNDNMPYIKKLKIRFKMALISVTIFILLLLGVLLIAPNYGLAAVLGATYFSVPTYSSYKYQKPISISLKNSYIVDF